MRTTRYSVEQIINIYISNINKRMRKVLSKDFSKLSYAKDAANIVLLRVRNYPEDEQFHILLSYLIEIDDLEYPNREVGVICDSQYDAISHIIKMYKNQKEM